MESRADEAETYVLAQCVVCGFWRVIKISSLGGFRSGYEVPAWRGVAEYYDVSDVSVPLNDLRRYLIKNPKRMGNVNPFVFESLVADCLKSAFPDCEIVKIGGVRDRGVDMILVRTTGENYLVQVKRKASLEQNLGVDPVRQLNGVLFREGAAKGIVVTSAKGYTKDAYNETFVNRGGDVWQSIELYSHSHIMEWLNLPTANPYSPWLDVSGDVAFTKELL